ncbi:MULTISPECIES: hypothetical protein [Pseudomonas]|uniref:hypothetical protein n=1 Tax=Pseudomonas TaxID=286 RepID=UPI001AE7792B|nr:MULTISPECIES: hypothetical protein [unclassified Pseudomonas]MBP1123537.1 hypothetical protein [Pseudomonas sp. PvP025]MDQ0397397.1 hypothetical protein [Pseudomonas sp. PvP006]
MSKEYYRIDQGQLPTDYPTHRHLGEFWEQLGRTVATYGFLEQVLGRAIFALTATRRYAQDELEQAYSDWPGQLERALSDPLGGLIDAYGNALRNYHKLPVSNLDQLVDDLRQSAQLRNVLCHGAWQVPDANGKSVPLFVDRKQRIFATSIDVAYLQQVRAQVACLACEIINSIGSIGLQFPGSGGPGESILQPSLAS